MGRLSSPANTPCHSLPRRQVVMRHVNWSPGRRVGPTLSCTSGCSYPLSIASPCAVPNRQQALIEIRHPCLGALYETCIPLQIVINSCRLPNALPSKCNNTSTISQNLNTEIVSNRKPHTRRPKCQTSRLCSLERPITSWRMCELPRRPLSRVQQADFQTIVMGLCSERLFVSIWTFFHLEVQSAYILCGPSEVICFPR